MALTSWKVFNFFDINEVSIHDPSLFDSTNFSSLAAGSESLFLGTQDGRVHILSSSFKVVRTFGAYDTTAGPITHMKQVNGTSLLVTIAEDLSNEPLLKVWALDSIDKKTNAPKCLSSLSIQNARRQFPISAFAALADLSQLAVGFANGAVTVVRGDLIHDRGARQRIVFESEEPVTGLEFREANVTTLFLSTTARLLTLTISGKGQGLPAKALDDHGCDVGCMTVDDAAGEVVVARNDAIYYYRRNGRRQPYAYEAPKQAVKIFGQYIAIATRPQANTHKSGAMRLFGGRQSDDGGSSSTFAILDTDLHFVAHTETTSSQIKQIFVEWGCLFILTLEGKILKYAEKPIEQKLEILYQRNLYIEAINIAQKANLDAAHRNIILKRYGDYLYQKGDYDTAMQQYLKAIDNTEPSQVIRKFLDTQRIHNLIEYLEELHEHDRATVDHTTLLLNCYAKLKDTEKLQTFINSDTNFDFDTAISMCRQGGYHNQAVFLARKHGEHDMVVDVLIEDLQKYEDALKYIRGLPAELLYPNLIKYARVLLEHCPEDTTALFISYYTGKYEPVRDQPIALTPAVRGATSALPSLTSFIPLPYRTQTTTSVTASSDQPADPENHAAQASETEESAPSYGVPKPRTAFSSFVDHPDQFIKFLEACTEQPKLPQSDGIDLHTALFEMYLDAARRSTGSDKNEWESKAKRLIDDRQVPIDPSNVLLLSHLSSYEDGTILVREQQGLRADIFRSYTSAKDTASAIKALRKYGPEEPSLYPAALTYFMSSPKVLEEAGAEVEAVLQRIERDGLMAPLQVIQTLSSTNVATMGIVKKYLGEILSREKKDIDDNRRIAASYRNSTLGKREEMEALSSKPTVFQARRCALCGASLDLPTVHFLCKHSFHQRCLNTSSASVARRRTADTTSDDLDIDMQCPICEKENETLKAIRRGQAERATKHELFLDALGRSRDSMATVSEFLGSGVMR